MNNSHKQKYAYERIVEQLHDGLYFTDQNRVITFWNRAAESISGFTAEEVVGHPCSDDILTHIDKDGNNLCTALCPLAATIKDGQPREAEVYMHHKNGHRIPVSVRVSRLHDNDGNVIGGVELFTDISSQEATALRVRELEKMALLDNLTQVANRRYLEIELEARFNDFEQRQVPFGVLFMDIDHFKIFNDTHGHDVGDDVLKFVAKTITTNARPFDVYGRWGGEEFIGIIRNVSPGDVEQIGRRMVSVTGSSYLMRDEKRLNVTISCGATVIQPGDSVDDVIHRADQLLYQSKANGRNQLTLG